MKLRITVHGVPYDVDVEVLDAGEGFPPAGPLPAMPPATRAPPSTPAPAGPGPGRGAPPAAATASDTARSVASPIAGTVVELLCRPGDQVIGGQDVIVIEAMKMKTRVAAPVGGRVARVLPGVGDNVREGDLLIEFG